MWEATKEMLYVSGVVELVKAPTQKELIHVSPLEASIWFDAMDNNLVKGCMVLWVIWTVLVVCAKFWK